MNVLKAPASWIFYALILISDEPCSKKIEKVVELGETSKKGECGEQTVEFDDGANKVKAISVHECVDHERNSEKSEAVDSMECQVQDEVGDEREDLSDDDMVLVSASILVLVLSSTSVLALVLALASTLTLVSALAFVTPPTQHTVSSEGVIFFYKLITFKLAYSYNVKHLTCTIFYSSRLQNIYKLHIWKCSTFAIFTLFTKTKHIQK